MGVAPGTLMKLIKPIYGQADARPSRREDGPSMNHITLTAVSIDYLTKGGVLFPW